MGLNKNQELEANKERFRRDQSRKSLKELAIAGRPQSNEAGQAQSEGRIINGVSRPVFFNGQASGGGSIVGGGGGFGGAPSWSDSSGNVDPFAQNLSLVVGNGKDSRKAQRMVTQTKTRTVPVQRTRVETKTRQVPVTRYRTETKQRQVMILSLIHI